MILRRITYIFVFILGLSFITPGYNFAASKCKGLKKSRCIRKSSCSWVKTHKRKGKRVLSYCRTKGERSKISKISPVKKRLKRDKKKRRKKRRSR